MRAQRTAAPIRHWMGPDGEDVPQPTAADVTAYAVVPYRVGDADLGVRFDDADATTRDPVHYWGRPLPPDRAHYYDRENLEQWVGVPRERRAEILDPLTRDRYARVKGYGREHMDGERFRPVVTFPKPPTVEEKRERFAAVLAERRRVSVANRIEYWTQYATSWEQVAAHVKAELVRLGYARGASEATDVFRRSLVVPALSRAGVEMRFVNPNLFRFLLAGETDTFQEGSVVRFMRTTPENRINPKVWALLLIEAILRVEHDGPAPTAGMRLRHSLFGHLLRFLNVGDYAHDYERLCFETRVEEYDALVVVHSEWALAGAEPARPEQPRQWELVCVHKTQKHARRLP